ncbi:MULTISPECIES: hypothetical protein [unclassified Curtobacterium]|uniref:hypothetical protein n=1 Tax=unclassified Curtobacterium TaxID=257496 RepID=UPI001051F9B9|nr:MULTISPECIES: hypothetical protein [unclassified Curtobacterium]
MSMPPLRAAGNGARYSEEEERLIAARYLPVEIRGSWDATKRRTVPDDHVIALQFNGADGTQHVSDIASVDPWDIVRGRPVRKLKARPRALNRISWIWTESLLPDRESRPTAEQLIGAESFNYESRFLLVAEFDPDIIAVASQPFKLRAKGRPCHGHVPDYLVIRRGRPAGAVDVRPEGRIDDNSQEVFDDTASAVAAAGWEHCVWTELTGAVFDNLSWLSRARSRRSVHLPTAQLAVRLLDSDCYVTLEEKLLDRHAPPLFVRPAIDHAIWTGQIRIDMTAPLDAGTLLYPPAPDRFAAAGGPTWSDQ